MPFSSQANRGEEKLGLILEQLGGVRTRLNGLAIQQGLFQSLSIIVAAGAIVLAAAYLLAPLGFLCVAAAFAAILLSGVWRAVRRAWRIGADRARAAAVADQRAGLKGRLTTVVALAQADPAHRSLWPYLIEDTLSRREEFTPAKVEPRRVSRSLRGLLASCAMAAILVAFALTHRRAAVMAAATQNEIQLDVNTLDVRPLDPDLGTGVEITGDPAAMRKLGRKLALANQREGDGNGAFGKLMGRARDLAGGLQDRLTGNQSKRRLRIRVTDSGAQDEERPDAGGMQNGRDGDNHAGQSQQDRDGSKLPAPQPNSAQANAGQGAQAAGQPMQNGQPVPRDSSNDALAQERGEQNGGGGSSHGSGSDPDNLFGQADEPPIGAEGFDIMIEARPAEHGPHAPGESYVPPKVRAALNSNQHPDEPIARDAIPDDDRAAIKRVFDR